MDHIKNWWDISTESCSSQSQLFEGDKVKKLIREYQIIFILTLGYLEIIESVKNTNFKNFSSIKNILANVHNNYLVFLRFLYRFLTDDQKEKHKEI